MPRTRKSGPSAPPGTGSESERPGSRPTLEASWKWLVQFILPVTAGLGVLAGLVWLGGWVRERTGSFITFTDIECEAPPGLTREVFLEEAQYLAGLPDRFNLAEPDTTERIALGLAKHPLVRRVGRVEQLPPGRVRAQLDYRVGVLVVVVHPPRVVDADGVLLPGSASREGLPVLRTKVRLPPREREIPGQPWAVDVRVGAVAQVAGLLHPHLEALGLRGCAVEIDEGDITLSTQRVRIRWGRPPGHERDDEDDASMKLDRLLREGRFNGKEYDLRPDGPR